MGNGEKFLNQAERKFGKLAFPGILCWVAGFQFLGFILVMFSQGYLEMISFDKAKIFSGEVWRLISWVFYPRVLPTGRMGSIIFLFFMIYFTFFINNLIEESIGTFRLNFYVVSMVVFLSLSALSPLSSIVFLSMMSFIFFSAMIFAAAALQPNFVINLFGIIPIKLKWIAWIDAALIVGTIAQNPYPIINTGLALFGLIPFLVGFMPAILGGLKNEATSAARRSKFQRDSVAGENGAFHACKACGITDVDDPTLEFRVSADDGEEYCVPCREKQN